jgi:hypothetical protein
MFISHNVQTLMVLFTTIASIFILFLIIQVKIQLVGTLCTNSIVGVAFFPLLNAHFHDCL